MLDDLANAFSFSVSSLSAKRLPTSPRSPPTLRWSPLSDFNHFLSPFRLISGLELAEAHHCVLRLPIHTEHQGWQAPDVQPLGEVGRLLSIDLHESSAPVLLAELPCVLIPKQGSIWWTTEQASMSAKETAAALHFLTLLFCEAALEVAQESCERAKHNYAKTCRTSTVGESVSFDIVVLNS